MDQWESEIDLADEVLVSPFQPNGFAQEEKENRGDLVNQFKSIHQIDSHPSVFGIKHKNVQQVGGRVKFGDDAPVNDSEFTKWVSSNKKLSTINEEQTNRKLSNLKKKKKSNSLTFGNHPVKNKKSSIYESYHSKTSTAKSKWNSRHSVNASIPEYVPKKSLFSQRNDRSRSTGSAVSHKKRNNSASTNTSAYRRSSSKMSNISSSKSNSVYRKVSSKSGSPTIKKSKRSLSANASILSSNQRKNMNVVSSTSSFVLRGSSTEKTVKTAWEDDTKKFRDQIVQGEEKLKKMEEKLIKYKLDRKKLNSMKQLNEDLKRQLEQKESYMIKHKQKLLSIQKKLKNNELETNKLTQMLKKKDEKIIELKKGITDVQNKINTIQRDKPQNTSQFKLDNSKDNENRELNEKTDSSMNTVKQIDQMRNKANEVEEKHQNELKGIRTEFNEKVKVWKEKYESMRNQNSTNMQNLKNESERRQEFETQLTKVRKKLWIEQEKCKKLNEKVKSSTSFKESNEKLTSYLERERDEVKKANGQRIKLLRHVEQLNEKVQNRNDEIASLNIMIQQSKNAIASIRGDLKEKQQQIMELERKEERKEKEFTELKQENSILKKQKKKGEQEKKELNDNLELVMKKISSMEKEKINIENRLLQTQNALEEANEYKMEQKYRDDLIERDKLMFQKDQIIEHLRQQIESKDFQQKSVHISKQDQQQLVDQLNKKIEQCNQRNRVLSESNRLLLLKIKRFEQQTQSHIVN